MAQSFRTVGTELEAAAIAAISHFREKGYTAAIEPAEFEYPSTPTLRLSRLRTVLFLEAVVSIDLTSIDAWVSFAKSRSTSTSFALLVVSPPGVSHEAAVQLRQRNVGVYSYDGAAITELIAPIDLTVLLQLPSLEGIKPAIKGKVRQCFEKIEAGNWIDGFRDACQIIESMAVNHLVDGVKRGRISFSSKAGTAKVYSVKQIRKMTQGALANVFGEIVAPTQVDSIYQKALAKTNKDRVRAVHKTSLASSSPRFRATVSQHLWTIASAIKQVQ